MPITVFGSHRELSLPGCCPIYSFPTKYRSLNRMLKKSASVHETWRVTREICEKGAIRSSKFGVRGFENLELRPSNPPPSCPSRLSHAIILRGVILLL
jgi:hypothetical protein